MGELVNSIMESLGRWIDRGINEDGSLRPGIYQVGDLPVSIWTKEERELVNGWVQRQFNLELSDIRGMEVGKKMVAFELIHRDDKGHPHLESDCVEGGSDERVHTYWRSLNL